MRSLPKSLILVLIYVLAIEKLAVAGTAVKTKVWLVGEMNRQHLSVVMGRAMMS